MASEEKCGKRWSAFEELGFRPMIDALVEEIQGLYTLDAIPWVIGYSGGKDSTAVVQLVWLALQGLKNEDRRKPVYVISTDTLVESPIVASWVTGSLERMREAAAEQGLPIEPRQLIPDPKDSFWVNLIGRGYPAPRHMFRWCTYRLKIQPSNRFIHNVVKKNGEAILVLGTRKAESSKRHAAMKRHEARRLRERLSPNANLPNSLVYTPVEDWSNDDVWEFLMHVDNCWGHSHDDLLKLYMGATPDGECPLVLDTSTPSCGTSRFGCWVCTLVDRDRSMEAMIRNDEEKVWMTPLLELRNELDPRREDGKANDKERRDWRRMNGGVQLFERVVDGKRVVEPIHGPYRKEWRHRWLRRLLEVQENVRKVGPPEVRELDLIRPDELEEIRRLWMTEKFEFEDALPKIYEETTGRVFKVPTEDGITLGAVEWNLLREECGGDELHQELIARLLGAEREFSTMGKRRGIYETLERCFEVAGFKDQNEAIYEAEERRRLVERCAEPEGFEDLDEALSGGAS